MQEQKELKLEEAFEIFSQNNRKMFLWKNLFKFIKKVWSC